jgi:hypothetical protein
MPPQADQDACGGGQFGYADEPVAGPGDAEVRGGFRIFGWLVSLAAGGNRQAAASSSEMVTNMGTS